MGSRGRSRDLFDDENHNAQPARINRNENVLDKHHSLSLVEMEKREKETDPPDKKKYKENAIANCDPEDPSRCLVDKQPERGKTNAGVIFSGPASLHPYHTVAPLHRNGIRPSD